MAPLYKSAFLYCVADVGQSLRSRPHSKVTIKSCLLETYQSSGELTKFSHERISLTGSISIIRQFRPPHHFNSVITHVLKRKCQTNSEKKVVSGCWTNRHCKNLFINFMLMHDI